MALGPLYSYIVPKLNQFILRVICIKKSIKFPNKSILRNDVKTLWILLLNLFAKMINFNLQFIKTFKLLIVIKSTKLNSHRVDPLVVFISPKLNDFSVPFEIILKEAALTFQSLQILGHLEDHWMDVHLLESLNCLLTLLKIPTRQKLFAQGQINQSKKEPVPQDKSRILKNFRVVINE